MDGDLVDDPFLPEEPLDLLKKGAWNKVSYFLQINMYQCVPEILYHLKILGKNTLYGIDNTEISETVLKYQISDFP